jgi:hypothetical protein
VFATVIHFQPSLIFPGKAVAYRRNVHKTPNFADKFYTRVEVNDSGEHTSLLQYGKNITIKVFIVQAPGENVLN